MLLFPLLFGGQNNSGPVPRRSRAKGPKMEAVLFDLDGTLLDTEPLSTVAIQHVISPFGGSVDWNLKKRLLGTYSELTHC